MMRGSITWNGVSSEQFGVYVEKYPSYAKPVRKMQKYNVPGRSGDIIIAQDAWENITQQYDIIFGQAEEHSATEIYHQIAAWLTGPSDYCELTDSFDPGHYRLAYFSGGLEYSAYTMGRAGKATVSFNCKPQRYRISGKDSIDMTGLSLNLYNPTVTNAKPLIKWVVGTSGSAKRLTVNGTILSTSVANTYLIDCEAMTIRTIAGVNVSGNISSSTGELPSLKPGTNSISKSDYSTEVTITPRWFDI